MIGENEFLLRPTREQPAKSHLCVCLLVEEITEGENAGKVTQDKCHQEVAVPDQAFCNDCENNEHHLYENQVGLGRHVHRKGKNA